MLRRFADARLRAELDKTRDARDQARDTARRLFRRLQAARAEAATHKALAGRWKVIAQGSQADLAAARQNIRDRYEHITKLELLVADLERQCNEQMHELAERARTQETTR